MAAGWPGLLAKTRRSGFVAYKGQFLSGLVGGMAGHEVSEAGSAITLDLSGRALKSQMAVNIKAAIKAGVVSKQELSTAIKAELPEIRTFFRGLAANTKPGISLIPLGGGATLRETKAVVAHEKIHLMRSRAQGARFLSLGETTRSTQQYEDFMNLLKTAGYNRGGSQSYEEEFIAYLRQGLVSRSSLPSDARKPLESYIETFGKERIPGFGDAYNLIQGLRHGGVAEQMRQGITSFGSPWDPVRAIANEVIGVIEKGWARNAAKLSEKAYTSFLEGAAFQRTLVQGRVVQTAGEGGFGRVELMETTFGGKKFQYVRKTPLGQEAVAGAYGEYRKMRQLQAFGVPTPYGLVTAGPAKGTMYMEYIPGEEAKELWKTGRLTGEHAQQIESVLGEAHARGFAHFDIWRRVEGGKLRPHNVMVTPQGQVAVIDWGAAKPARQTVESMRREGPAIGHPAILSDLSLWPMTAAETDLMLGESLNRQLGAAVNRASQQVAPVAPDVLSGVASVVERRVQVRVIPPQEQAVVQASLSAQNLQQRHAVLSQVLRRDQERVWNNARSGGHKHHGPEAFASTMVRDTIVDAIGFANTLIR